MRRARSGLLLLLAFSVALFAVVGAITTTAAEEQATDVSQLDYYQLLGVERDADKSVLRTKYRALALKVHRGFP